MRSGKIRDPHTEEKQFFMVFPLSNIFDYANFVSFSRSRMWVVSDARTMNRKENVDAVIFRQSVQLHTAVSLRPGALTGCIDWR
jgi:hypothetical protein